MSYAESSIPWKYVAALPMVSTTEITRLTESFIEQYHAEGPIECWFATRAAVAATELERIERDRAEERAALALRSTAVWDLDREIEIETVAAKLKKDPARISRILKTSKHGALWLIDRWRSLGRTIDEGRAWTDTQRSMALDLLGVPIDERDGHTKVDPPPTTKYDCATERQIIARLQIEMLQKAIDGPLSALDTVAQRAAGKGMGVNPRIEGLRKQAAAAERHLKWAIASLEKARKNRLALSSELLESICEDTDSVIESETEESETCPTPTEPTTKRSRRRQRERGMQVLSCDAS